MRRDPRQPSHPAGDNPAGRTRGFLHKASASSQTTERPKAPMDRSSPPGPSRELSRTPLTDASRHQVASSVSMSAGPFRPAPDVSDNGSRQLVDSQTRHQLSQQGVLGTSREDRPRSDSRGNSTTIPAGPPIDLRCAIMRQPVRSSSPRQRRN